LKRDLNRSYSLPAFSDVHDSHGDANQVGDISPVLIDDFLAAEHVAISNGYVLEQFETSARTCKWQQSVLAEKDFIDEWTAQDRAFHLAAEFMLAQPSVHQPVFSQQFCDPIGPRSNRSHRRVTFKDDVDLYIGLDEAQSFFKSPFQCNPSICLTSLGPLYPHEVVFPILLMLLIPAPE